MGFGTKLNALRRDRKMGLRELAKGARMNHAILSKIENELRPPPELQDIFALSDALRLSEDELDGLLELATQPAKEAGARLSAEELERLRKSRALGMFMRRKPD